MVVPDQPTSTSLSLLQRVRRLDSDAWQRLCSLYSPLIYGWCRRAGLQENDAADAMQEIFRSVFRGIGDFQKNPQPGSFRGWLWAITRNQVRSFYRKQRCVPQAFGGSDAQQRFAEHPDALDDSEPAPDDARRRILHRAVELVRRDFTPATWAAFSRVELQGQSIQQVAADLTMTSNAIRQAKFRVLRRLREELAGQI